MRAARKTFDDRLADLMQNPGRFGMQLPAADRGVDKFSLDDDGKLLIFGTGIHLKVKGEAYAIGLWRLTVDRVTGDLISQEYFGNFDLTAEGIDTYLCSALGE